MRTKIAILTYSVALCHFTVYCQPFELPWDDGVSYHVSRTGTPAPSGSTASTCYSSAYASFSPHTYVAIDFDSPNSVYDPVRAADDGTVIFVGINGSLTSGYGRLVKIQHANGTITYYAHLNAIYVSVNDVVEQGCIVGDGGTTGNSTGDHIHFEWRDDGDIAFSNNQYPTFTECSCIPKQGYCYESGNANGTCGNPCTAPSYDEPCSAGSLLINPSCSFVTRTIECATKSSQISNASCDQPSNVDVWFTFTIPSGMFGIRTESVSISSDDCGLAIYTGSCSSLIERHCIVGGNPSQPYMPWDDNINLNSYAGQTGYIRLWEYGTASQTGDFEICITGSGGGGSEDITVTNTYVSSTTVACGSTVDVESDHVYSGSQLDADLPSFDLDYYLSTDCNYNSSDVSLGNGETSSLGSDDPSNTETATLTIPAGTSAGTYYILFVGDADDELTESNESNNVGCEQITVTCGSVGSDDITVANTFVSSTVIECGNTVDVESDHVYSGSQLDADLPSFDLDYYLSTDCNYNSSDVSLGNGETSSLGSDDPSNTETATLTIPAGTSAGTYYILFVGDADDELGESNESNNVGCEQITVTCSGTGSEDITITNTYLSSNVVTCGSTVDVESDHVYSGNQLDADLPSFDLDYYLSTDCNLGGSDVSLGNGETSTLGSDNPFNTEAATLTIPSGTATGTYYILFVGDADNELSEPDENNNVVCEQINVTCGGNSEDIAITNTFATLSVVVCGSTVDVDADHVYSGNEVAANLPTFDVHYYLSSDCGYSGDDMSLGSAVSTLGSDNSIHTVTETLTIPTEIPEGDYYILIIGDADDELSETNETNNLACVQITVDCVVGQEEIHSLSSIHFTVLPNPNRGSFTVQLTTSTEEEIQISILDILGREIFITPSEKIIGVFSKPIEIKNISDGMYFVKMRAGKDFVSRKIIINR